MYGQSSLLLEGMGEGGGQRPKKKGCVSNTGLKIPAPFISFIFCRRTSFLMLGGGGRPGLARAPNNPLPRGH